MVPPLAMGRTPATSVVRSMLWPRLVRQVPFEAKQPAVTFKPFPEKVEVAEEVFNIEPPVMVRPAVEDSPPTCAESPPSKVEVEVLSTERLGKVVVPRYEGMLVARSAPPVIVTPLEDASPPVDTPPVNVEVAEVVAEIRGTIKPV